MKIDFVTRSLNYIKTNRFIGAILASIFYVMLWWEGVVKVIVLGPQ